MSRPGWLVAHIDNCGGGEILQVFEGLVPFVEDNGFSLDDNLLPTPPHEGLVIFEGIMGFEAFEGTWRDLTILELTRLSTGEAAKAP